jgi:acetylornithine/N-succinyldiaminopimelate aminotransferase
VIPAVMPTYDRRDVAFERGEGCYLFASDGRRYLDFCSGIAVTALGHAHPHLVAALKGQAEKVWHVSNLFRIPEGEALARRLVDNSFADTVFFCNSGAEAMEGGIKLVRKYHDVTGNPHRFRIIACTQSFHGRTLSTLAAAGNEKYLKGFDPAMPGFSQVPFGNLNVLRDEISDDVAAILVEPVQGEGGVRAGDVEYLRGLRAVCDEYGLLLFLDEVQCGMGRTGKLFAHEWAGITPDVVGTAKGLGGGFPVGALLATEKAAQGMTFGTHGSTFGGNPLAMSVANAVLDVVLAPGFLDHVCEMSQLLHRRLAQLVAKHPKIFVEVRGKGLLAGLRCQIENTKVINALFRHGLVVVGAGDNVIRLLPPLIVEEKHIDEAIEKLEIAAHELVGDA